MFVVVIWPLPHLNSVRYKLDINGGEEASLEFWSCQIINFHSKSPECFLVFATFVTIYFPQASKIISLSANFLFIYFFPQFWRRKLTTPSLWISYDRPFLLGLECAAKWNPILETSTHLLNSLWKETLKNWGKGLFEAALLLPYNLSCSWQK